MEIKQLIAKLKLVNPQVEYNIFKSVENVMLNQVIAYKTMRADTAFGEIQRGIKIIAAGDTLISHSSLLIPH